MITAVVHREHRHLHVIPKDRVYLGAYVNLYDPTRTTAIRAAFVKEMKRRFKKITKMVKEAIIDQDVFGLKDPAVFAAIPPQRAFAFPRSSDKVTAFMQWFNKLSADELLEIKYMSQLGTGAEGAWTNMYVGDSYKRGVIRARYELSKAGQTMPDFGELGDGGIATTLSTPFHADRIGLMYTRAFDELKGITNTMGTQISKVLSQGMIDGDGPALLARKLTSAINGPVGDLGLTDTLGRFIPASRRAEILARTEVIRAHHNATVQEYRNWGMAGVKVQAEWSTAGDSRVCTRCSSMEGRVFTLDEIESMIPLHPQCRCIALPTMPEKEKSRQRKPRAKVEKVSTPKQTSTSESVASRFINPEDQKLYRKYEKEFDDFFNTEFKDVSEDEWKKWTRFGDNNRKTTIQRKLYSKMGEGNDYQTNLSLMDWMGNTHNTLPMQLKEWASRLERGMGDVLYPPDFTADMIAKIKQLDQVSKDMYIRLRASNQSYMKFRGYGQKIKLSRGINGPEGAKIRKSIIDSLKSDPRRTKFGVSESSITGYSSSSKEALHFAKFEEMYAIEDRGVVVLLEVDGSEIIVHADLMAVLNRPALIYEKEFLITGGNRSFSVDNIIWDAADLEKIKAFFGL